MPLRVPVLLLVIFGTVLSPAAAQLNALDLDNLKEMPKTLPDPGKSTEDVHDQCVRLFAKKSFKGLLRSQKLNRNGNNEGEQSASQMTATFDTLGMMAIAAGLLQRPVCAVDYNWVIPNQNRKLETGGTFDGNFFYFYQMPLTGSASS